MVKRRVKKGRKKTGKLKKRSTISLFKKPNCEQIYRFKCMCSQVIINSTGAIANVAQSINLLFPTGFHNNSGGYAQMSILQSNFLRATNFFDVYRVKELRVYFEPNAENLTGASAFDAPYCVYMCNDHDDNGLMTEVVALNDGIIPKPYGAGSNVIVRRTLRPYKSQMPWLNTGQINSAAAVAASINPGTAVTYANQTCSCPQASIKTLFPNVPATSNVGRLYAEWDVEFKGVVYN